MIRRLLPLVLGVLAATADAAAQAPALERYVAQAVERGTRFVESEIVLHLEAGRLEVADALALALPPSEEAFTERYHAVAATALLAQGDAAGARRRLDAALRVYEFSAPLRTASGMTEELAAHLADPECTGVGCRTGAAEREYRLALQRDDKLEEARLRLGRVLALQGKASEARTELTRLSASSNTRIRYLSRLFAEDYEGALAVLPGAQAPQIALSLRQDAAGNATAARQRMAAFTR